MQLCRRYNIPLSDQKLDTLMKVLTLDILLPKEWFDSNYMKLNHDKHHLIVSDRKCESAFAKIVYSIIWESESQKRVEFNY